MAALCNSEITPNKINGIATYKYNKPSQWSELPSIALEKIYSYLIRVDQVDMSVVCRNWSVQYGSPSVWKSFKFELMDWQLSTDTCPLMKFVIKYGNLFRHVEIHHKTERKHNLWCRHLIDILQHMTSSSKLVSIKFRGLSDCFEYIDASTRCLVNRAIADFLGSQHQLKLEFESCFAKFEECVKLLSEIDEDSNDSIMNLRLGGLSNCEPFEEQDSDGEQRVLRPEGLQNLTSGLSYLDYSLIFKDTLTSNSVAGAILRNTQRLALSEIIINYGDASEDINSYDRLISIDWLFLKDFYPDLQVKMYIALPSLRNVRNLIVPNMPISLLDYTHEDLPESLIFELDDLLNHLLECNADKHLVSLNLVYGLPIPDIASTFSPIVQACKKIEYLGIFTKSPINGLHLLMESWLKNRPQSLNKVFILIAGMDSEHDRTIFIDSTTDHVSRLQKQGINVEINFDIQKIVI